MSKLEKSSVRRVVTHTVRCFHRGPFEAARWMALGLVLALGGPARAGLVGISIQPLTPELAEAMGIPVQGIVVRDVVPGGPADHAGVHAGDVILELNRKKVENIEGFIATTREIPAGKSVSLTVWREGLGRYFIGVRLARDDRPQPAPSVRPGERTPGVPAGTPGAVEATPSPLPEWRTRAEPTPPPDVEWPGRTGPGPAPQPEPPPVGVATPSPDGNLVHDGGFERGLVPPWGTGAISEGRPWRVLEGARAFGESIFTPVHSGRFSLSIKHLSDEREGWIGVTSQRLGTLASGGRYVLAVWAKGEKLEEGAIRVRIVRRGERPGVAKGLDEAQPQLPLAEIGLPSGAYDWIRLEAQFEAPGAELDLEILSVDNATAFIDDVSVHRNQ